MGSADSREEECAVPVTGYQLNYSLNIGVTHLLESNWLRNKTEHSSGSPVMYLVRGLGSVVCLIMGKGVCVSTAYPQPATWEQ